jgi:hypothetical protein
MKKLFLGAAFVLMLGGTFARLYIRWREEAADKRLVILVDWAEIRDDAARQGLTHAALLERLHNSGANALLVGASTVQDYAFDHFSFSNPALADAVHRQMQDRGIVSPVQNWERFKDAEVGFNPELLGQARQAGFRLVLRVNNDPWLAKEKLFSELSEIGSANQELGFLLNSDDVPGGADALATWVSFLQSQGFAQLLFEFHPSKSAMKTAYRAPQFTYRAHTIPSIELKDLTPAQERSRWLRAVQERSCRFLLFHMAPNDSLTSYFERVYAMRQALIHDGWEIGWPVLRMSWTFPSLMERQVNPFLALLVAIVAPILALRAGRLKNLWSAFLTIVVVSLAGACVMAALSDNPLARIEIVPFRGVKLAFALAWLGCFLAVYPYHELKAELFQNVRRIDILVGLVAAVVVGYLVLRTGNAGGAWKAGWEQGLRDRLEDFFIARPRFKEFAIGYPLLVLGLYSEGKREARCLVALGMIGPISMINTFCHLHSPLYLAFWRSLNGILLGAALGWGLTKVKQWIF